MWKWSSYSELLNDQHKSTQSSEEMPGTKQTLLIMEAELTNWEHLAVFNDFWMYYVCSNKIKNMLQGRNRENIFYKTYSVHH